MRDVLAFLPYVLRTTARARVRTLLTVLGAALAIGLLAFVRVVDEGVAALQHSLEDEVLVVFQDSRFCPLTSELPVRYADRIREIEGVREVLPTLVYVNSCRSNLDLVTLHGVDPAALASIHRFTVLSGDAAEFRARSDAALVGERLAERRGLVPGERVRLGEVDVHVSAIVRGAGIDNLAFVHLDQLALARDRLGGATQFLVRVDPAADPQQVAAAIDARFRTDEARTDTKTLQAFVAGAVAEIAQVVGFSRFVGYLAVFVVGLLLANTVFISTQARAGEMGVLETIGLGKGALSTLVVAEGVGLGLVGGAVGAGAVMAVLGMFPLTLGIEGHGIDFTPSLDAFLTAVAAAAGVGLLAALPPALDIARRPLALAVREE